ncbi:MAG: hypothetical protein M5Z89_01665 [Olivibacter sp.]|nr:hypothetical protein [Olivibacter sp. UJ_SKK_5.1]
METKDFIEKMIEDMSEAMKRLLKMDFNAEGEAFIHEFEQWAQHNVEANNNLLVYLKEQGNNAVKDTLLTTDLILVFYRASLAYQNKSDSQKSNYYRELAASLENKPRTISFNNHEILGQIDGLKNALHTK